MSARGLITALRPRWTVSPIVAAGVMDVEHWLPRTMAGWVGIGCIVVAAPLLVALLLADLALARLAQQAQTLTDESLRVAHIGTDLRDTLSNLERNSRQYLALREPALGEVVSARISSAGDLLEQLERRPPSEALRQQALLVKTGLGEIKQIWQTQNGALEGIGDRLHTLLLQSDPIADMARASVDQQMRRFSDEMASTRRVIVFSALTLVPFAGLLAMGFSVAVTHPLRRMGRSIAELGHGRYDQAVSIGFPYEMQRLGERLDWLRRRLAMLDADKDRFLRHVSHELKTPLASLREGAALLHEGSLGRLTPQQTEVAQILIESSRELETLIGNLLTYSEWRRGDRQMDMAWFDAGDLIEEVLVMHRLPMAARRLSVELHVQSRRLFGQRVQLRIALDNLFTNAIKHAPEGSVVQICTEIRDGSCQLWVRDQGRGVPNDDKKRIFEPFVRGAEAEESSQRGAGVGLSIVHEVAEAHGGCALVEDAGPGARFCVRWPCPQP
ncbi:MAG: HAMP domain-containing histidine kinase [Nevskiaceae bacterium]|nr:MAG: HAMP domain-containing histidine kinase [Nevskiaceae bacterium]